MGKTRKCRTRENGAGREKKGKGREKDDYRASPPPPLPIFLPFFFFRVRVFSIPRARLSRSLEQATQSGAKETKFFGAVVIFM